MIDLEPPDNYYLSESQLERLYELAQEKAADDPDLGFPDPERFDGIELDGPHTEYGGYAFTARYAGQEVSVWIDADIFAPPDEPDYWD